MFGKDKMVKFIDFGFAITNHEEKSKQDVVGTPYYIAPEVIGGVYGK